MNCGLLSAAGKGPTLLLVKDKQGQLFGGYASEPWLKNGKYYGELHYLPTTCCCHLCLFNLFVDAVTSVPLKEQWPGLGKAAETVSSLDHLHSNVCIQVGRKQSLFRISIVVAPCRQLLYISVPAVAQSSHVQPQRSKSELPVLWPQFCLTAQWHWLWWTGERLSHDLPACLLHRCMHRHMLQVHVLLRLMSVRHL